MASGSPAIKTPLGTIVHTGDFKFDSDPVDGRRLDRETLKHLGDQGVLALISDSTNVESPGWTPSERSVRPALERSLANAKGRVFLTSFASHVHRFQQVLEAAEATGRVVAPMGRSMEGNMRMAWASLATRRSSRACRWTSGHQSGTCCPTAPWWSARAARASRAAAWPAWPTAATPT